MSAATSKATKKTAPKKTAPKKTAAQEVRAQEIALAEQRGAEGVRDQLRAVVEENRRVVRVRNQQVEVVETAALDEILEDE